MAEVKAKTEQTNHNASPATTRTQCPFFLACATRDERKKDIGKRKSAPVDLAVELGSAERGAKAIAHRGVDREQRQDHQRRQAMHGKGSPGRTLPWLDIWPAGKSRHNPISGRAASPVSELNACTGLRVRGP
jgi:hypothetical protein